MGSLTAWAGVNLIGGTVGMFTHPCPRTPGANRLSCEQRFFHQMNALWNTVNLTLGVIGLVSARREDPSAITTAEAIKSSRTRQKVFLINAALDLVYIAAGGLTWALGSRDDVYRATGYGQSVVLQGAYLLVFDTVMVAAHERKLRRFLKGARGRPRLAGVSLAPIPVLGGGAGVSLAGRF